MTSTTASTPTSTSTSAPTCTTAVPGKYGYVPPDACNSQWSYAPSYTAALTFAILFGMLTAAQLALAIIHRKGFCWVVIMGAAWEFLAFIFRSMGAHNQQSSTYSFAANVLFLLAPLWINAYVYMTAGRLIWMFHPEKRVWFVKALSIGKYFVWLDILSFLVQLTGGVMLNPGNSANTMKTGKNIYMTGVGIQQGFIVLFISVIVQFHITVQKLHLPNKRWMMLTISLYVVLALITMRIIFRLVEFSAGAGTNNPLPYHEKYALILDAAPMTISLLILALIHPGLVLKGPESEFPSRKARKAEKKALKAEKKAAKTKGFGSPAQYENLEAGSRGSWNEPLQPQRGVELGYMGQQEQGVAHPGARIHQGSTWNTARR